MLSRYKTALAKGREAYEKVVEEDQRLFEVFGLTLLSVEPGVRVCPSAKRKKINPWDVIQIESKLWVWLRPLLVELVELRRAGLNGHALKVEGSQQVERNGGCCSTLPCQGQGKQL